MRKLDESQYSHWLTQLGRVQRELEALISVTPTSDVRNLITEANLAIMAADGRREEIHQTPILSVLDASRNRPGSSYGSPKAVRWDKRG